MLCTNSNAVQHDVFCHAHRYFPGWCNGIPIRYRFDGKLFYLRRLQAKSKVPTDVLDKFLFADKAKGAPIEGKMQKGVDKESD